MLVSGEDRQDIPTTAANPRNADVIGHLHKKETTVLAGNISLPKKQHQNKSLVALNHCFTLHFVIYFLP